MLLIAFSYFMNLTLRGALFGPSRCAGCRVAGDVSKPPGITGLLWRLAGLRVLYGTNRRLVLPQVHPRFFGSLLVSMGAIGLWTPSLLCGGDDRAGGMVCRRWRCWPRPGSWFAHGQEAAFKNASHARVGRLCCVRSGLDAAEFRVSRHRGSRRRQTNRAARNFAPRCPRGNDNLAAKLIDKAVRQHERRGRQVAGFHGRADQGADRRRRAAPQ